MGIQYNLLVCIFHGFSFIIRRAMSHFCDETLLCMLHTTSHPDREF